MQWSIITAKDWQVLREVRKIKDCACTAGGSVRSDKISFSDKSKFSHDSNKKTASKVQNGLLRVQAAESEGR